MKNPVSILHISDFHKRTKDNFDNLLSSLKTDCNNYVIKEAIPKPNIVVVSGDLVQGGTTDEIKEQYQASLEFLNNLTDYYLDKDKSRMIIVPGNHDVNWNVTKQAMSIVNLGRKKTEKQAYKDLVKLSHSGDISSLYRWSWEEQRVFMINDRCLYNTRFAAFRDFFNDFYNGIYEYPEDEDEQFHFFDLPRFGITFLGLNSCFNNDHLNRSGTINPRCVANASSGIEKRVKTGQLVVGVWHHHTIGLPFEDNYLDYSILDTLVGNGIQLALHGHQHYSAVAREHTDVYDSRRMVLLSTGSLYGGEHAMSYGVPRQYNVIVLSQNEDKIQLTLHSRADMSSRPKEIPNWVPGIIKGTASTSWSSEISAPTVVSEYERIDAILREYETTGNYDEVIKKINDIGVEMPASRRLILDLMQRENKYSDIISFFMDPMTDDEAIALIGAAIEINDPALLAKVKNLDYIKNSTNNSVVNARKHILR